MGYLDGFGVTLRKWVGVNTDTGRRVTTEYPEEVRPKPERFHGRHVLNRYEDGMEKCIGCELCAGVCPASCIYVRGQDNDPDDPTSPGERFGYVYEINYLRCIHCDLCVEACPTEAITETKMFEFAFTNRADGIYTKDELLVDDEGRPRRLPYENWDGGFDAARDTSGWMRSTAPNGDADFVGIVAWAGELGYGVRAPERDPDLPDGAVTDEYHASDEPLPGPAHGDHDEPAHEATGSHGARSIRTPGSFDLDGPAAAAPSPAAGTTTSQEPDPSDTAGPDGAASDVIKDLSRAAGEFDAGSDESVAQQASASPTAGPGVPTATDRTGTPETEEPGTPGSAEPDEAQPPTRGPGMFDAADADEPAAEPKSGRWRRGKGDR